MSEFPVPAFLQNGTPSTVSSPRKEPRTPRVPLETATGVVKWFNVKDEFGFLTFDVGPQAGKDIFVHITEVAKLGLDRLEPGKAYAFLINKRHKDGKQFAISLKAR